MGDPKREQVHSFMHFLTAICQKVGGKRCGLSFAQCFTSRETRFQLGTQCEDLPAVRAFFLNGIYGHLLPFYGVE